MNNHQHNHTTEAERIRAELEDYLMDQNLEEVLGGVTPNPEERTVASAPDATHDDNAGVSRRPFKTAFARLKPVSLLVACAAITLVIGLFFSRQQMSSNSEAEFSLASQEIAMSDSQQMNAFYDDFEKESLAGREANARREEAFRNNANVYFGNGDINLSEENTPVSQHIAGVPITVSESSRPLPNPNNPQSNSRYGDTNRNGLSSGYYLRDDVKYFPAGPGEKLPNQKRALEQYRREQARGVSERYGRSPVLDPQSQVAGANRGREGKSSDDYGLGFRQGSFVAGKEADFDYSIQDRDGLLISDGAEGVGPGNRGDNYAPIIENEFISVIDSPLSTFSIDVDTASYSNMRRMLTQNSMLPPPDAVRIEEMVNYFNYDYPAPEGEHPFSVNVETASCPWRPANRLLRIALKGKEIPFEERPASNLVFLLDVSGSMDQPNKLPLLKTCFKMMVDYLTENDRIAIVVYASGTRQVLPSTSGDQKAVIMEALDQLQAGGSTNGAGGIELAYQTATANFIPGGINRVILATDGDFNVGITSQGDLHRLIQEKAKSNIFLTTLGFGFGNLQDNTIELLADKGNGNYAYIDSLAEGRKVLIDEMGSTLNTIAKDVKIQIEFNPVEVAGFRLIGYENRIMAHQDFNDDTKDAGEIGAGHTVTAFYEIIPAGKEAQLVEREVDELEFQRPLKTTKLAREGNLMLVKLRYKNPTEDVSKLLKVFAKDTGNEFSAASRDFQFAASVASFGMLLRNSQYAGQANFKNVLEQAQATLGETPESYRAEFVELVKLADRLAGQVRN